MQNWQVAHLIEILNVYNITYGLVSLFESFHLHILAVKQTKHITEKKNVIAMHDKMAGCLL